MNIFLLLGIISILTAAFWCWMALANAQLSTVEFSGRKLSFEKKSEPEKLGQMVEQVQEVASVAKEQDADLALNIRHELKKPFIHPPLRKIKITSGWGNRYHPISGLKHFHNGVDLEANYEPVMAVASGKVVKVAYSGRAGLFIVLDHGKGVQTSYAHLHRSFVNAGKMVAIGESIGISGNTGRSTAPHLHFCITIDEVPYDPMNIIK